MAVNHGKPSIENNNIIKSKIVSISSCVGIDKYMYIHIIHGPLHNI